MTAEPDAGSARTPRARRLVAAGIGAEAIVVIGYALVLAIAILVAKATSAPGAAFLAVLVAGIGVGVAALALGVWRGRRWARAPGLVWQVLQLAVAVPAVRSRPVVGIPLAALAGLVLVGLFVPGVVDDHD
jgi:hypothetical protein